MQKFREKYGNCDRDYVGSSDPNNVDLTTDTDYEEYTDNSSKMAGNDSNKPTPFTGDRSKTESFLHQMTMYLVGQEEQYKVHSKMLTNREKIALFHSFLQGPALVWSQNWVKGKTTWPAYTEFIKEFRTQYATKHSSDRALL